MEYLGLHYINTLSLMSQVSEDQFIGHNSLKTCCYRNQMQGIQAYVNMHRNACKSVAQGELLHRDLLRARFFSCYSRHRFQSQWSQTGLTGFTFFSMIRPRQSWNSDRICTTKCSPPHVTLLPIYHPYMFQMTREGQENTFRMFIMIVKASELSYYKI